MDALSSRGYDASIHAICWMQGESDSIDTIAKRYYDNQSRFVNFLRSDLERYASDNGIRFIDAGINNISLWPEHDVINSAKERFAEQSPLNIYFSTADEGLTTLNEPIGEPDVAHYDAMSELKLGHLFGRHIIKFYEEIN